MKKLLLAAMLALGTALAASAASPFVTKTAVAGPGSATNYVIIPSQSGYQTIVQRIDYRSATNVATLGIQGGSGAWTQTQTNLSSTAVTNMVNSTNGFVVGSLLVLEQDGVGYVAGLSALGQTTNANTFGTNIVLATGGWGVAVRPGASIYQLGTAATIPVGAATNSLNGNCIFAGDQGRPVVVWLGPAGLSNYLSVVTEGR